jgi:PIF1 helicase.
MLRQCKLLVWDESTKSHKKAIEALNRTLQDLRDSTDIMGGMVVFLAGDFRQTLPVTPQMESEPVLNFSSLWAKVEKFDFKTNMTRHLHNDVDSGYYAEALLKIGEGRLATDAEGCIVLSREFGILVKK